MKTVILCRHAESKENVKIRAYKDGIAKLKEGQLPSRSQVAKSFSLLKYNTDEAVSPLGLEQILSMSKKVSSENFLENFQPQVGSFVPEVVVVFNFPSSQMLFFTDCLPLAIESSESDLSWNLWSARQRR